MHDAFTTRVTRAYAALALALVAFTCVASILFALRQAIVRQNDFVESRRLQITATAQALSLAGRSFSDIAATIAKDPRPGTEIEVFDSTGRLVAGSRSKTPASIRLALGAVLGGGPTEFDIPGGKVRIGRDPKILGPTFRAYVLFNVPIAIAAAVLAWWIGRRITRRALRPLATVTDALNAVADGDFTATSIVALDRSELTELIAAFNRAMEAVTGAMSERDAAQVELRRFIGDAGHELRTPLTVIMGYVEALLGDVVTDRTTEVEILGTIRGESRRMRHIVEDLIVLARLGHRGTPHAALTSLRDALAQTIAAVPSDEKCRIRDGGGDAMIEADRLTVESAIRNVMNNALRYTTGRVDVDIEREGVYGMLRVRDEGPGMTADEVRHAFTRFYRGRHHASTEGTGLGLSIAKMGVEAFGGNVTILSSPAAGTLVTLRLPLASAAVMQSEAGFVTRA